MGSSKFARSTNGSPPLRGVRTLIKYVSPATAINYLKSNRLNRNLSEIVVDNLTNAMKRGAWKFNGEPIIFAKSGRLVQGQHRLHSVEKSGMGQHFVIVRGVEDASFDTLDCHNKRKLSDVLSSGGNSEENSMELQAAINVHHAFYTWGTFSARQRRQDRTFGEKVEYLRDNPAIRKSLRFVKSLGVKKTLLSLGKLAALHALFTERDEKLADEYVTKFITGSNIRSKEPVSTVRDKLINNSAQRRPALKGDDLCTVLVIGWNSTRQKKPLLRIQVSPRKDARNPRTLSIS